MRNEGFFDWKTVLSVISEVMYPDDGGMGRRLVDQ